jgi:hypothetical protein
MAHAAGFNSHLVKPADLQELRHQALDCGWGGFFGGTIDCGSFSQLTNVRC